MNNTIKEKILNIEKYCMVKDVMPELFNQYTEEIKEYDKIRIITQFKCLTDRSVEKVAKYPKTWFEMFKKQYFPIWLLDKFPIKYHTVSIKLKECFPTAKYDISTPHYTINYMDLYE